MQTAKTRRTSAKPVADDRITARIPRANRLIIERAAAVYGATLNQFIVQTALDRAGEILEREEALRLSERDSQTFLAALENPPEPSEKLIEAMKAHNRLVKC
ncbi:MAG: DUF1778 domain-containing protein [Deltaproteobacteria bacterium]|nr:DUF1778 domain-containing protein [Deltaproteobacteria bacterium]